MGSVIGILAVFLGTTALIVGSIATYKINHPTASAPSNAGVSLDGTQTLTNKTLVQPEITRLIGTGSAPTVAITGSTTTVAAPSLGTRSSDMAGIILSDGLANSTDAFSIVVTFSTPYPVLPSAVIVSTINDAFLVRTRSVTSWDTHGFTIICQSLEAPMPSQGGTVPFWTYVVIG